VQIGITRLLPPIGRLLVERFEVPRRVRNLEPSYTLRTLIRLAWASPLSLHLDEQAV
jgi:hypothetical protein